MCVLRNSTTTPPSLSSHPSPLLPTQASTARPARADDAPTTTVAPPPPAPAPPAPTDEAPLITELRARSAANKARYDAERLASYYRRNADALRVIDTPGLDPAIRARIKAWLNANA